MKKGGRKRRYEAEGVRGNHDENLSRAKPLDDFVAMLL